MNRKIVLFTFVLFLGSTAFAQFRVPAKTILNAQNLERAIAHHLKGAAPGEIIGTVPFAVFSKGYAVLTPCQFPAVSTPVTKSYENYIQSSKQQTLVSIHNTLKLTPQMTPQEMFPLMATDWLLFAQGKAFYDDQSALARTVDRYYRGRTDVLVGPDGREVKLYALPVDGILYKPAGYKTPVVLNSNEYFVIYDVQSQTGKIAPNQPDVYNLFKPRVEDEIWQTLGIDKTFEDLNNLCDAVLMTHLHKKRLQDLRPGSAAVFNKEEVQHQKAVIFQNLHNPEILLSYLKQLPQVRQVQCGFKAYVVELPVEGLSWVEESGITHRYNRAEHVILFFEFGSVGVYPRAEIEDPALFKPIENVVVK